MTASASYPPDSYPADQARTSAGSGALDAAERAAWWLALAAALVSVVVGIMIMVWPSATLKVVVVLVGLWLLVRGLVQIVQAVAGRGRDGAERVILGLVGVFFVGAGILALRNLFASLVVIATVIGLMWLLGGIVDLIAAFGGPGGGVRVWRIVLGLLSIGAALVILIWPDLTLVTLVYISGLWLVIVGLIQVGMLVWARRSLTAM
jgi:uncharacterized membrane protein HdeD (DUF308 family)